jgi:hypothetical protein
MQILSGSLDSFMGRVRVIELRWVDEARGQLIEIDHASLPFLPRRTFIVTNVPAGTSRGGHSHRECEQLFVCLQGSITIDAAFGDERAEILLDVPRLASGTMISDLNCSSAPACPSTPISISPSQRRNDRQRGKAASRDPWRWHHGLIDGALSCARRLQCHPH